MLNVNFLSDPKMEERNELVQKLKGELIDALNLEEIDPEGIGTDESLFGAEGLGLDSIDALEIILLLDRNYGIKIKNPAEGKEIFKTVGTIADYILAHKAE